MIKTYKVISLLLTYPNQEIYDLLTEVTPALKEEHLLDPNEILGVETFMDFFRSKPLSSWQEFYVQLFDYSRSVSLYLFEHVHGDSKDRGQAMVDLIDSYSEKGLVLTRSELPDYLPVFLEFLALQNQSKAREYLADIIDIIGFIYKKLEEKDNPYKYLLSALIQLSDQKPTPARIEKMELNMPETTIDEAYLEKPVTFGNDSPCVNCKS
ncbi:nitrate reductase molybdenum cofactor assembly chaperone [Williamwhitmania taraxaci]|uniref:Respiratory nitrate reductase chaperone NarJ n=1 Tax=Williamwhitmania taraxaci TaxID=1640674 RepID=A0A1G6KWN6_9BACT|nr:nitrate reductase molybdenum cofactor assembly chaperone [Williamwhitmania taraxaci]SDC35343.1 respiratory nitrate reductase chaperone NarJ [Williamwhitmania taraxaci]